MRTPLESNRRRKKRIDVAPGKSISTSDLRDAVESNIENENATSNDHTKVFGQPVSCQSTSSSVKFQSAYKQQSFASFKDAMIEMQFLY